MTGQAAALRAEADGGSVSGEGQSGDGQGAAFPRSVSALLERTEYRRCESGEDLEAIYRLRYKAYKAYGLVGEAENERICDAMDDTPNSYRFGVFIDGELVSTVRLHHITAAEPWGPVMRVYSDMLEPRLAAGETFVNPGQFTADPSVAGSFRLLPYLTLRLAVIANTYFDSTSCVCLIRDEHVAFYKRIFGSAQVGLARPYPPFTVPVMLYESNCEENMAKTVARYPFFRSTFAERRLLFQRPDAGELTPLTVLPTAKYRVAA